MSFLLSRCFVPLQLASSPSKHCFTWPSFWSAVTSRFAQPSNPLPQTMEATHGIFDGRNCLFLLVIFWYPNENHHFAPSFGQKMFFPPTPTSAKSKLAEDTDAGCLLVACQSGSRYGYALLLLQMLGKKTVALRSQTSKKRSRRLNCDKMFLNRKF